MGRLAVCNSLSKEERTVYDVIRAKGDMGIWTGDIQRETASIPIPKKIYDKALENLVGKGLIKRFTNIRSKARKFFIASEYEPSQYLTGGDFYTSQGNLDSHFIHELNERCLYYLSTHKLPATIDEILEYCTSSRVFKFQITHQILKVILDNLVLDNSVSEVRSTGDFAHDIPIGSLRYTSKGKEVVDRSKGAMASVPCGVCPRIHFCTPDGTVNPTNCLHYKKWS
ncbi:hypothetical protein RIF29_25408 [Crotalaria pallida]|uniref:DNA-directed RNA polymerase III subunit RPC6 n=1 Tax=Crotalaria pallida TaxID=3830 RepID=A0AAN9HXG2_CROPI